MPEPVSPAVFEEIAALLEGALRSDVVPWREDPDGFYRSSAVMLTEKIVERIEDDRAA